MLTSRGKPSVASKHRLYFFSDVALIKRSKIGLQQIIDVILS
ncbi:Uncharacterised protein [Klebsiella quasipneumoniae]|nr:Uncharacterised protein [Klebsiella quasipneumoniae]